MRLLFAILIFFIIPCVKAQHPVAFFTAAEAAKVKKAIPLNPLLQKTFNELKADVDGWLNKDIDVPVPKDPAGGYTHDKHKNNYMLMFNSGLLYQLTGKEAYAVLVKNILLKYAVLNPTLKKHPQAKSSSPGHLFHQALNDANWMVYTGMAYDFIYNSLSAADRATIENGAFKPEVDFFTKDLNSWFNLVHNHGVWACAGVGIIGLATNNNEYVQMALKGTEKDGKSGFLAQLQELFSPDGYYTEGPYYVRYAMLPFYVFANAINNAQPQQKIFSFRDSILKKALYAGLQQTNLNGAFFPVNDALKEKDFTTNELVTAIDIAWNAYGADSALLFVASKQKRILLNAGGAAIASQLTSNKKLPLTYPYKTVEYKDGKNGDEGGISFLRNGKGESLTTLIFKYTSHGLSHGHFDKLNINLFDNGNEVLTDYGSARFVNIEQKYGGRYLPENDTYASQTIAHNTVTADEQSHFNGEEKVGEKFHSDLLFSVANKNVQVVSAVDKHAYDGIEMQRTIYTIQLPGASKPLIVDLFNTASATSHQYDLPFNYSGTVMSTSFKYKAFIESQKTLGNKGAYKFLWKVAEANPAKGLAQMTFLNAKTFYTISTLAGDSTKLFFTRVGANDPNFNLRNEPSFIIRKNAANELFFNAVEIHGSFDPVTEFNTQAGSLITGMKVLWNSADYTVAELTYDGKKITIMQSNKEVRKDAVHEVKTSDKTYNWKGPFTVLFDNAAL